MEFRTCRPELNMFQHYLVQTESDRLGILTPLKRKMFIPKKPFDKQTERFWTFVQHDLTSITTLGSRGGSNWRLLLFSHRCDHVTKHTNACCYFCWYPRGLTSSGILDFQHLLLKRESWNKLRSANLIWRMGRI